MEEETATYEPHRTEQNQVVGKKRPPWSMKSWSSSLTFRFVIVFVVVIGLLNLWKNVFSATAASLLPPPNMYCCCCCWLFCCWWYSCWCSNTRPFVFTEGSGPRGGREAKPKPTAWAKGAVGPPVNCCTMARKLVVSVLSRVVGVRLEARERRLMGLETRPSGFNWVGVVVVTVVASDTETWPAVGKLLLSW